MERTLSGPSPLTVLETITLREGVNTIELEASPADMLPDDTALETRRAAPLVVVFTKIPTPPPRITLQAVEPLADGEESLTPRPDEPLAFVVDVPRVRLVGRIEGVAALSAARTV